MALQAFGDHTAARARDDEAMIERLADLIGLSPQAVRERLSAAIGTALLRNVFAQEWPVGPQQLGALRVQQARDDDIDAEIQKVTGLDIPTLMARLHEAPGNATLATIFKDRWPKEDAADVADDEAEEATEEVRKTEDKRGVDALRLDPNGGWSRPRQLATVLKSLDWEVPGRLRTPRFQTLLAHLSGLGVEIRPADDEEPIQQDADSPGIAARVCLRIAKGSDAKLPRTRLVPEPLRRSPVRESALPPPSVAVHSTRPPAPMPTAPILPALTAPHGAESDWDLGVERLQFLTAVPSMHRHRDREWPSGFVAAAVEGLSISAQERGLLERLAAGWVRGSHNPLPLVNSLVDKRDHHDLGGLIGHFRRLNRDTTGAVEEIVRWIEERRAGPRLAAQAANASPQAAAGQAAAAVPAGPNTQSSSARHAPEETASAPAASDKRKPITRKLGVLDDMFDD